MSNYSPVEESICGCYEAAPMSSCAKTITLGQLASLNEYKINIEDKFGNLYQLTQVAQAGKVIIDVFQYPEDTFNEYTGKFSIKAFRSNDLSTPVQFTFNGEYYQCINISFVPTNLPIDNETIR